MRVGRMLVVVSGLVAALGASACDSGDDPGAGPSPTATPVTSSASATPSASPTPTPSETTSIPAAARKNTPEGAEAFVRHYLASANAALRTGDGEYVRTLGTRACEFCRNMLDTVDYLKAHDERYSNDAIDVRSSEPFSGAPAGQQYIALQLQQNAVDIVDGSGEKVRSETKAALRGNAAVRWSEDGWHLIGIEEAA